MHYDKAQSDNIYDTIMDFNLTQGDVLELHDVVTGFNANDLANFIRIEMIGNDAMIQVNKDGQGNDFKNVALIKDHAGIDTSTLDVQQLFDQGYIDVA